MKNKKVVCGHCGSENLRYFREFHITRYYKLDKYNNPTNKIESQTLPDDSTMPYNWECEDCLHIFGGTASPEHPCEYKEVD